MKRQAAILIATSKKHLFLPIIAFILSSTKLEIKAK
jgi:hypothetical protein